MKRVKALEGERKKSKIGGKKRGMNKFKIKGRDKGEKKGVGGGL